MNDNIKNYLGVTIIGALIVFALGTLSVAVSYSESSSQRNFTVFAEGKSVIIPDIAQFTFSVITEGDKNISALQKENTDKANKVNGYLRERGVDKKDIKTQDYSVEPRYQYSDCDHGACPPPEIIGYSVRQTLLVKVRDAGKAGDFLSGVVSNGTNSVSQLTFTVDDRTKYEDEARAQAIDKAKQKAKTIAKAGGFSLGKLISISEDPGSPPPYPPFVMGVADFEGGGGDQPIKIEQGSQEVLVNISLTYEIK